MANQKQDTVNLDRIGVLYHNACGYKRVFYEILKNINKFNPEEMSFPTAVVNGMLSIELFIKFIHANSHKNHIKNNAEFYIGHNIWDLYTKLDKKIKGEIRKKIGVKAYSFMRKIKTSLNTGKGLFGDVIEWRYLTKNINQYKTDFNSMTKIVDALYEIASKIRCKPDENKINLPLFMSIELTEESKNIINDKKYQNL